MLLRIVTVDAPILLIQSNVPDMYGRVFGLQVMCWWGPV